MSLCNSNHIGNLLDMCKFNSLVNSDETCSFYYQNHSLNANNCKNVNNIRPLFTHSTCLVENTIGEAFRETDTPLFGVFTKLFSLASGFTKKNSSHLSGTRLLIKVTCHIPKETCPSWCVQLSQKDGYYYICFV